MRFLINCVLAIVFLPCIVIAQKRSVVIPNAPVQTIPQDYVASMNRQEERLDQIDGRMVAMETSLKDFKEDTLRSLGTIDSKLDDLSTTNIAMKFVLAIVVLLIPTLGGVWFAEYLKRRREVPNQKI